MNFSSPETASAVYADYNATSPLRPSARDAMLGALDDVGNASSIHSYGRAARQRLEGARADCLSALGKPNHRLAFVSGATEALSTCLRPGVQNLSSKSSVSRLVIGPTEHVAALDGHGFAEDVVHRLSVDDQGRVDPAEVATLLTTEEDAGQTLVCVQGANNESGVIQPVAELAALCRERGALMVCDLVQWTGRLPMPDVLPDIAIVSSHKLGGPSGIGALVFDPLRVHIAHPLLRGGGQERGIRGGTENLLGAIGFAAALREATTDLPAEVQRLRALRDGLETQLQADVEDVVIFGEDAERVPNTSSFAIPGKEAALALMQLDLAGVAISSGSACSSGKVTESHVLQAMGVEPELARCALRVSFGFGSTDADVGRILSAIKTLKKPV
ncbi:MAG: cysteine desulfurase family protein [Cohaesibacteraceae bacterium]